ncbi:MAG: cytochrome b [Gammaproteobacteria bacterium]|nr:cytochrome b [Gammaproteobacteria bacterium]
MLKNTNYRYGSVTKLFHWLIVLLVLLMFLSGYFGLFSMNTHKLMGLSILALMVFRIVWRLCNPTPELPPHVTRFEKIASHSVQGLLYLALLAMPLSGWIMATAKGHFPSIGTWMISFPGIPLNHFLGELCEKIHETLAIIILVLIGLHFLGAMKHYFIDKDGILQRMLPRCCHRKHGGQ